MDERTLLVVNGMTGRETPVRVGDGATSNDVLASLGLEGYNLARVRDRKTLAPRTDLSRATQDRERLFAFAPMEVGARR